MLKRSSRLKKRRPHVFYGLQGNWKSHAALPAYDSQPDVFSNKDGVRFLEPVCMNTNRVICLSVMGRHTYIHVYCCSIIKEARKCHRAGSSENKQPVLLEVWHEGRFVS